MIGRYTRYIFMIAFMLIGVVLIDVSYGGFPDNKIWLVFGVIFVALSGIAAGATTEEENK